MKKPFKSIKEFFDKIKIDRRKRKVKKVLVDKYEHDYEVELLLEEWIIKRILDGATERRKELAEKQARLKEMKLFINHFKQL